MADFRLCPLFEAALHILGKRWTALIVRHLLEGPQRFGSMTDALGISGKILSERLKELEAEGIVRRTVYPETPVRIEYGLTEKGRALRPVLDEMQNWADAWLSPGDCDGKGNDF